MKILFIFYDNERRDNILPLGLVYIAGYLKQHMPPDVEIKYYCQDVYHYPESHLTDYLNKNQFDIAAIGFCAGYYQHIKVKKICDAIHKADSPPKIVLGGHGPSGAPEYFLKYTGADHVVVGEGEEAFNIICKGFNESIVNSCIIDDLDTIPFPYLEGLPIEHYIRSGYLTGPADRGMGMVSSRGCPYHCNFCYRLEQGHRFRSPENVVEEIKKYQKDYYVNFLWFWDELWMASEKRVNEMCEAFVKNSLNIKFFCTGRLNIANKNILKMMKKAGCVAIDYGIEQFDNEALKAMNKRQTEEQVESTINLTLKMGIQPLFNIIWGNTGDTKESLRKSLVFLKQYNDYKQLRAIRPVTPYPGSPLYDEAVRRGLIKDHADFYSKHLNLELPTVNFMNIPDDEVMYCLWNANHDILADYYQHVFNVSLQQFRAVYFEGDYSFRGVRH